MCMPWILDVLEHILYGDSLYVLTRFIQGVLFLLVFFVCVFVVKLMFLV